MPPLTLKSRRSTHRELMKSHAAVWTRSSGMSLSDMMSQMSHLVTSSDQTSWTVVLTVVVSVVEKPCKQKRSRGGEFTLKRCAAKEISGEDQMRWLRMRDLVSSEMLYTRKLRGKSASSLLASGQGGDTFTSWSS